LLAPLLLIAFIPPSNRRAPRAFIAIGICGAALIFLTQPNLRYVYPALPFHRDRLFLDDLASPLDLGGAAVCSA